MRNRIVITILFTALLAASCLFPLTAMNAGSYSYQQRQRGSQTRRKVGTNRSSARENPSRDYSKFSHRSDKHKSLACAACHKAPTDNWQTVSGFPDVADYPAHDACTRCHRPQFFKGALPVICSICHTKVSPRGKVRFGFGKPKQPSQFSIIFPHDLHQNVIASNGFERGLESAHAILRKSFVTDEKTEKYNNCTICHKTQMETLNPNGGFPDNFKPDPGTFKTAPTGHASCFNCHWKNQEPTHEDCEKCHELSQTDNAMRQAPKRKTLKFKHLRPEGKDHEDECTVCHINITRKKSLVGLQPDVPISKCGPTCHGKKKPGKVNIYSESEKRKGDPDHKCEFCHTSDVGSKRKMPASHEKARK